MYNVPTDVASADIPAKMLRTKRGGGGGGGGEEVIIFCVQRIMAHIIAHMQSLSEMLTLYAYI